jgi:tetratricopeptide (TPR) repeat protein
MKTRYLLSLLVITCLSANISACVRVPQVADHQSVGSKYYPKLPPGIETLDAARKDLTDLLKKREKPFVISYLSANYRFSGKKAAEDSVNDFNPGDLNSLSYNPEAMTLQEISTNRIFVLHDRIDIPFLPLFFEDLYGFSISEENARIDLPNHVTLTFGKEEQIDAQKIADDLFFIQQNQDRYHEARLALFESRAAQYRTLKVKPPVTEEQRRFIVQANALNQQKKYGKAIDLYKKAIDLDPVSYPGAYFNMALLYAQERRFKQAISCMTRYLRLEPEAKDARSAQDKIYEWEAMLQK